MFTVMKIHGNIDSWETVRFQVEMKENDQVERLKILFLSIFHASEGSFGSYNYVCYLLVLFTALVRAFPTVSDCITTYLPYSLSNSLSELFPVVIIRRLWFSASFNWDDRAYLQKRLRNLGRVLRCPA